ncbi:MAG: 4Fe-4S dicluster domain-containing protein [Spirochaetia bacterium]|nr:4Fe-4S dicluster domain-containing protein [Spirochaetia bacterium]
MAEKISESMYSRKKYPVMIHFLNFFYSVLNSGLNRIFSSRLNPLAQTGAWTVFFLSAAFVSGGGLIFFYKISDPYQSIVNIQEMVYLARWLRAMHRYSADAALITITFHILKMMVEGKTWGPRLFSWVTGVFNTGLLFVSAYTGYVMVWDNHAKLIAVRGAQLLDYLHFSSEALASIFSGEKEPDSTFFFINLFTHVAIPLGMAIMLWLHTSRLTRPDFFPGKKRMIASGATLLIASIIISAPLIQKADLLSLGVTFPVDIFYSGWFLFSKKNALLMLSFYLFGMPILLFLLPLIWKPKPKLLKEKYISKVNLEKCNGSSQCYYDCPYGAIEMKDRPDTQNRNEQYAYIDANQCVGCGLCSASCRVFAIGPEGKVGTDILHELKIFMVENEKKQGAPKKDVLVFSCKYNENVNRYLKKSGFGNYALYELPCTGILHSAHIHSALGHFSRVALISCAESQCVFRFGNTLLEERVEGKRKPTLPEIQNEQRVSFWSGGDDKLFDLRSLIEGNSRKKISRWNGALGVLFLFLFYISIAGASQIYIPTKENTGLLRFSWKLAGQRDEICRDLSEKEMLSKPKHMRKSRECREVYYPYILKYKIGDIHGESVIHPAGLRKDRPLIVFKEIDLKSGIYPVTVEFFSNEGNSRKFSFSGQMKIAPDEVTLITRDRNEEKLILLNGYSKPLIP